MPFGSDPFRDQGVEGTLNGEKVSPMPFGSDPFRDTMAQLSTANTASWPVTNAFRQ